MKNRKALSLLLALGLAIAPASSVLAAELNNNSSEVIESVEGAISRYDRYTGIVTDIAKEKDGTVVAIVSPKDKVVGMIAIRLDKNALVYELTDAKKINPELLQKGDELDVFIEEGTPMTKSMPGEVIPKVVVRNIYPADKAIDKFSLVDRFDGNLTDRGYTLQLLVDKDTKLENVKGEKVKEADLYDRDLLVFYSDTTKSIPAQTNPLKVIVLGEKTKDIKDFKSININGKKVVLDREIYKDKGEYMLPLREIVEKMAYEIKWNGRTKPMQVLKQGEFVSLKLGDKTYETRTKDKIKLDRAPELKAAQTYVPLDFFNKVLKVNVNIVDGVLNIAD